MRARKLLRDVNPQLACEFSPKNTEWTLKTVGISLTEKVLWRCSKKDCGYEWSAGVADRHYSKTGCPNCRGLIANPKTSLVFLFPQIAKEYSQLLNTVPVDAITAKLAKPVWWTCDKAECGYSWPAPPGSRTRAGKEAGCPDCAGKIVNEENSLVSLFPEYAKEYAQDLNETPLKEVFACSKQKYKWRCAKGHVWAAIADNRTRNSNGCPYCNGRLPSKERNLLTEFPDIALEFDLEKNYPLTSQDFTPVSDKKVWWKCASLHSWFDSVAARTGKGGHACGMCTGHLTGETNNITVTHPEIAAQYHPTMNTISVDTLRWGSHEKVWWKCVDDSAHFWKATVVARTQTNNPTGCKFCKGSGIDGKNNLAFDNSKLAKEFDLIKNYPLTPEIVRAHSKRKVYWKCEAKGHYWLAAISTRNNGKYSTGCPDCYEGHTSLAEKELRQELKKAKFLTNITDNHKNKLDIKFFSNRHLSVDILGEHGNQKVVVEYDGQRWHSGELDKIVGASLRRDIEKTQLLLDAGYIVVRVREHATPAKQLPFLPISHKNLLQVTHLYYEDKRDMRKIVKAIRIWFSQRTMLS